jgi:hypothetical protein
MLQAVEALVGCLVWQVPMLLSQLSSVTIALMHIGVFHRCRFGSSSIANQFLQQAMVYSS